MSRRTQGWAEIMGVRLFCLFAGVVLAFFAVPVRAQEAGGAGEGVGADAAMEPEADPQAEVRRKKEEAAAAKRKAAEEAAAARREADEEKRAKAKAARDAKIKAAEERRQAAIAKKAAARKAKILARKRREEEARKKRGVKGQEDIILDDETLAKLRKPEDELKREAQIEAAQVSLPSDIKLEYLWSLPLERPVSEGDIWVHGDVILLLADRSVLYCIRKRDGVPMWAIELGDAPLYPPAVGKRMVYAFVKNSFMGIDRSRGEVIWQINPGFSPSATPCVSEPYLYVPAWDNRVYAVEVCATKRVFESDRLQNPFTSVEHRFRKLWHRTTGGYILGTPVLNDGFLYFASEDGYLYAVGQDGEDRYNAQTQGPIRTPVTSGDANVYVGSADYSAYAFDRLTGRKRWVYPTGSHVNSAIYPDVRGGVALVCSNKNGIFGICDRAAPEQGTPYWHIPDAVSIAGVSPDFAYLILSDKRLAAVQKKEGTVQWVSLLDGIRSLVPTMNDWTRPDEQFRLICLTESGHLACLREAKESVRRALEARQ